MAVRATVLGFLVTIVIVLVLGLPVVCAPLLAGDIARLATHAPVRALLVLGSFVLGGLCVRAVRHVAALQWLDTLQHELAHATIALLLGASPKTLHVSTKGGEVAYTMSQRWWLPRRFLIAITPYVWSPLLVVPCTLALLVHPRSDLVLGVAAGLLGLGLVLPLAQIHPRQVDLTQFGYWPALLAALWLWSAEAVCLALLVLRGTLSWLPGGVWHGMGAVLAIVQGSAPHAR